MSAITTLTQKPEALIPDTAGRLLPVVCMVTSTYPPDAGGGGMQARTLANALARQNLARCVVVALTGQKSLAGSKEEDGIILHRIYVDIKSPISRGRALWQLTAKLAALKNGVDVVHLHGFTQKNILVVLLNKWLKKPVIQKLTSLGSDDPSSLPQTPGGWLQAWSYAKADRIIAVTPALKASIESQPALREKAVLIGNGVDCHRFAPVENKEHQMVLRRHLGLPQEAFIVLSVGFFSREKDPLTLWRAWQQTFGKTKEACLTFVGATRSLYFEIDPTLAIRIRQEAEKAGCADRVIFIEQTQSIESCYQAADLFAFCSHREGLPNALLEAMACGLPCIATQLPGVAGWLVKDGDNGLLVEPKDANGLAEALTRCFSDKAHAKRLGSSARQTVKERFAIEQVASEYAQLYRALMAQNR